MAEEDNSFNSGNIIREVITEKWILYPDKLHNNMFEVPINMFNYVFFLNDGLNRIYSKYTNLAFLYCFKLGIKERCLSVASVLIQCDLDKAKFVINLLWGACSGGGVKCSWRVCSGGVLLGGVCSGGVCSWRGVCSGRRCLVPGGCLVETPPTATAASGTHPTGMHSCLHEKLYRKVYIVNFRYFEKKKQERWRGNFQQCDFQAHKSD